MHFCRWLIAVLIIIHFYVAGCSKISTIFLIFTWGICQFVFYFKYFAYGRLSNRSLNWTVFACAPDTRYAPFVVFLGFACARGTCASEHNYSKLNSKFIVCIKALREWLRDSSEPWVWVRLLCFSPYTQHFLVCKWCCGCGWIMSSDYNEIGLLVIIRAVALGSGVLGPGVVRWLRPWIMI